MENKGHSVSPDQMLAVDTLLSVNFFAAGVKRQCRLEISPMPELQ